MLTGYQIKSQDASYYLIIQIVEWGDIFTRKNEAILEVILVCRR